MKTFIKIWLAISLIALTIGTITVFVILVIGGGKRAVPGYSLNESYENVSAVDFNIKYGKVYIKEGDGFSISAENISDKSFKSYVEDGVWHIKEDDKGVFGWDISFSNIFGRNEKYSRTVTITLPQDFTAEKWIMNIGAGEVYVETISTDKGHFDIGAGYLGIERLEIKSESDYKIGAGSLVIRDMTATDSVFDCGVGNVEICGTLMGDSKLSCSVGRIKLKLIGSEEDYSYELSAGLGSVVINDRRYHNIDKSINNKTDNRLMIDCGIGGIEIAFK